MIVRSGVPQILGKFELTCPEMMFVQYMPICMPRQGIRIPANLNWMLPLLHEVVYNEDSLKECFWEPDDRYIYLTAKHMYVEAGTCPNRPGWHIDGFGTDDVNYIWSDTLPTLFCIQDFDLSEDHVESMRDMEEQVRYENVTQFGANRLIRLDQTNVHCVQRAIYSGGMRTFVKISISKERYNLKGNAHNYLFNYHWQMQERSDCRNHPVKSD